MVELMGNYAANYAASAANDNPTLKFKNVPQKLSSYLHRVDPMKKITLKKCFEEIAKGQHFCDTLSKGLSKSVILV